MQALPHGWDESIDSRDFLSTQAHLGGRWYFEATLEDSADEASPVVGILAKPSNFDEFVNPPNTYAGTSQVVPAARMHWSANETIGIAANLDAGLVSFFKDGWRVEQQPVLRVPGVGAFHAAASIWNNQVVSVNLGSDPFVFQMPFEYEAWATASEDAPGVCVSDQDPAVPSAPVTAECGDTECLSSFEAETLAETELIVLSAYEAGNETDEVFLGPDRNFHPAPMGSLTVKVKRAGRIGLVLFSLEAIDWTIEVAKDTQLDFVSLTGGEGQLIRGVPKEVPLEVRSYCGPVREPGCVADSEAGGIFGWPYSYGAGDTQAFVDKVEVDFCLPLKIYAHAYAPDSFVVE